NYPNPFNGLTAIEYSLSQPGRVRLSVFNIAGQCVATLVNGLQLQGSYRSVWDASEQASGLYFYRLQMNDFVQTRKMVLAH
ncbi:MAG TPA: T9SS type A sorting domain-containing protein, partial [bacterium]|nr:T9SS type A sorting domain-containing protein [bacterium]